MPSSIPDPTSPPQADTQVRALGFLWDVNTLSWIRSTAAGAGSAVTIADGADVAQGTTTDVAWSGAGAGTVVAILKKIASAGGSAVSIADGADVAQGTTTDVAWVSGAGTVISLLKKIASAGGGAVSVADGADVAQGATTDAAVITDTTGTLSGKLRGLVKWAFERMPASLGQKVMASSLPVVVASDQGALTVSGTVTANAGTNLNTSALALDATVGRAIGSTTAGQTGPLSQGAVTTNAPTYTTAQTDPLSLDTSGNLRVSLKDTPANTNNLNVNLAASAATVTVTGTVTTTPPANASTNVAQFGGSAVVTGTGTGGAGIPRVTVSSDSSVTANAGTNLNTSLLALDTTVGLGQASTTTGQRGPLAQGAVTTNAPTYTTAQTDPLSLDTAGNLRVSLKDTPANTNNLNVNLAASAATVTVSGTVTANQGGAPWSDNVSQFGGSAVVTGTGVSGAGIPRVTVASDSSLTANQGGAPWTVAGTKSSNAVVPGSTNLGTLPAVANAAAPTYTEGNQVGLSTDLAGNLRISGTINASTSASATANGPLYSEAASAALSQDLSGHLRVIDIGSDAVMQVLAQILTVLKSIQIQTAIMADYNADPREFPDPENVLN